ncbi:MAG: pilus assembly protein [Alphaproteobacteria bacterium]|nr:pilus assembly protein [Alphaproteobacteria bacterium]
MSSASNRRPRRLGNSGVTSLEFAIIAVTFMTLVIGCMDLGRYYIIEHSLRAFTSEAARAALVDNSLSANGIVSGQTGVASLTNIVPFLDPSLLTLSITQNRFPSSTPITITVTATYQFTAFSPIWAALTGTLTDTTKITY